MAGATARFRDQVVTFANGVTGVDIEIPSGNPRNYHQLVNDPDGAPRVTIDGKLFLPPDAVGPLPLAIVVPGSLSVAASHLSHAEALCDDGMAAFVLDPFGGRAVLSTVADQTQFSFAASAYDVMMTVRTLTDRPDIDASAVHLQGHSRGGSAVLLAAMTVLHRTVLGDHPPIRAVYAAYPWCGHQPLHPTVGPTKVRSIIGTKDGWCSPQQAQGFMQAIRLAGCDATFRLVEGAEHSFDRYEPVVNIEHAAVAPHSPTTYLADDGSMIHPATGVADAALTDRDVMVWSQKAGFGVRGAAIGSTDGQPAVFRDDMMAFHRAAARG